MKISVVFVTCNEAMKAKGCLESLIGFADEIVVVDLESTDGIKELAKEFKAKLIPHRRVPFVELIRDYSISQTSGDWVLVLDPDERITPQLSERLLQIAKDGEFDAVNIPFKNIFWGKWIAHTNFWPDKHIRFFRRSAVTWPAVVHSYPKVKGRVLDLEAKEKLAVEHYGYDSKQQFFNKQIRYAKSEATNIINRGEGFSLTKLIWMPIREFLARFIKHQGYKDGFDGIFLVASLMWYQLLVEYYVLRRVTVKTK